MPEVIVQQSAVHHVPEDSNASWLTQRVSYGGHKDTQAGVSETDRKQPGLTARTLAAKYLTLRKKKKKKG